MWGTAVGVKEGIRGVLQGLGAAGGVYEGVICVQAIVWGTAGGVKESPRGCDVGFGYHMWEVLRGYCSVPGVL